MGAPLCQRFGIETLRSDFKGRGARRALYTGKVWLRQLKGLLCDSGYVGQVFAQGVCETLGEGVTVRIAKRSELHTFKGYPSAG
jgi:hypothetical protein